MASHKRKFTDDMNEDTSYSGEIRTLKIKVTCQLACGDVYFKIKETCRLHKLLKSYCENQNLDYKTMRFLYNGNRIHPKHTPKSLRMKNNDEIDAMTESGGGGGGIF